MKSTNKLLLIALTAMLTFGGCKKDWDSHNAITDEQLNVNLFEKIQANSKLSKFAELLVKSGYDKVLASSKNFTVYAPTNDALTGLDPAIVSDTAKLNPFIANHIANQSYYSGKITDTLRIEMLNFKFHNVLGNKIESAAITEPDQLSKNGVLQVIDKMLPVLPNCWDAMYAGSGFPLKQAEYLKKLNYTGFDPNTAEVIGIDPLTGNPIYKPGTGSVPRNMYWDRVYDLRIEKEQYTYFAIDDAGFDGEAVKFATYYKSPDPLITDSVTRFAVLKDYAFKGKYAMASLPDTMVSKSGVKVGIDKSKITRTISCSNGVIYVMSAMIVAPATKFISRVIQAENYASSSHDRRGNTFFRDRLNTVTGLNYRDVLVQGHGVARFSLRYPVVEMPTMKFRAYWVAVNDFQTATFSQKLSIDSINNATIPYVVVPVTTFTEVFIGEFTLTSYIATRDIYLTAANSTTAAANPLVCDYIRIEPVN